MTQEQLEMLKDAWYILRDVSQETQDSRITPIMAALHSLIDSELSE